MPIGAKLFFTLAVMLFSIGIYFVDPKANNAGPDWIWVWGKSNPWRTLICRPDGTFRRFTKPAFFVLVLAWLADLWLT